jgi:cyanophycin synthetase
MKKIAVTGTKGKTTVVNLISKALLSLGNNVLQVDTTGHFVNGVRKSTLEDSKKIWGLVPSVCPGRYLWELSESSASQSSVAVLECSVGCSTHSGLGYGVHDVGIFLNVFEDHLGSSKRLKTKEDIAIHKSFIFNKISTNGFAIFNADDQLVVGQLHKIPKHLGIQKIPVGIGFEAFDVGSHVSDGGKYITAKNDSIWLIDKNQETKLCDISKLPWTFDGHFEPSIYNAMFVCAGVLGYCNYVMPENFQEVMEGLRMDVDSGRLVVMRAQSGAMVIADYAHEKESLKKVGELSKSLVKPGGKNIGVVRLAYDRTDQLIAETAGVIAESFDKVIVYDKIDGFLRKAKPVRSKLFKQVEGKVSQQIYNASVKVNPDTERIVREDMAVQRAAEIAGENDVVVVIVNDDITKSMDFIKDSFKGEIL